MKVNLSKQKTNSGTLKTKYSIKPDPNAKHKYKFV